MNARVLSLTVATLLITAACAGDPSASAPSSTRPSSPAQLVLLEPELGSPVATTFTVRVELVGARIADSASRDVVPDEGHVHVYLDDQLISMTHNLAQVVETEPGTYELRVELVASDHAPFVPSVTTTRSIEVVAAVG